MPKFPEIVVQLTGQNGNAFNLVGIVREAMRGRVPREDVEKFTAEAFSGDYDHLLATCTEWVTVK